MTGTEVDGPTVAYTGDQPVPETMSIPPMEDSADNQSVCSRNIPGYERVVAQADYLVSLKTPLVP